jgi:hypothetical protein
MQAFLITSSLNLLAEILALRDKYEAGEQLMESDWLLLTKRAKDLSKVEN